MTSKALTARTDYWEAFKVTDEDLDLIYNLLLEREKPLTSQEMMEPIVEQRLQELEREAARREAEADTLYLPADVYEVGQEIRFPVMGGRLGEVVGVREGDNPEIGPFQVIQVRFPNGDETREFATGLEDHPLNQPAEPPPGSEELDTVAGVIEEYGEIILGKVVERLQDTEDIVRIAGRWFPKALLAEIHEGHLNLAEAVLDVEQGGPLPTQALLEHIELPSSINPLLAEFSLDYALQEDERFDEVGPAGEVLWFLKKLEPPEVLFTPPRLQYKTHPYDRNALTDELLELERQLDDELSPLETGRQTHSEITFPLLFPHWRVGALPLSTHLKPLFPTAYEAPRIRFILIDGHSGEKFEGWVVREERYVFGLDEFYRRYKVPAGGLIQVKTSDQRGEVIVETKGPRQRNDWIRTVSITDSNSIGFTMLKQPVGTDYDDLMVVGLMDPQALDEAWLKGPQREMPLNRLVAQVFRELARLNPQSAVHAKSLYSGVNVLRRVPPAPIFHELVSQPYLVHVGDLYWRLDESLWGGD